jgi:hypothetical protein
MPSVERAAKHTTDKRVHDCIAVIHDWIAEKPADLTAAAAAGAAVTAGAAAYASRAAEREAQRQDLIAAFPPLILKDQTNDIRDDDADLTTNS